MAGPLLRLYPPSHLSCNRSATSSSFVGMNLQVAPRPKILGLAVFVAILVCACTPALSQAQPGVLAQSASSVEIDYTGALFGYFRNDGPTPGEKLTVVKNFLMSRVNRSTLLLGMGDNFAPEFGAALQYDCKNDQTSWESY